MVGQMTERQARLLRDLSGGQACIAVSLDAAEGGGSDLGATIFGGELLMASGLEFHGQDVFQGLEIDDEGGAVLAVSKADAATMRLKQGSGNGKTHAGATLFAPRGEEWREDAIPVARRNARAVVGYGQARAFLAG
jgi:hypothetical protein